MNTRGNKAGRNFLRSFFFGKSERTRCAYDDIERKDATSTKSFWKYCTDYEICFPKMQDESPGIEAERRREEKAERHGKGAERHRQKICRQAAPVWRIDGKIWHLWYAQILGGLALRSRTVPWASTWRHGGGELMR